MPIPLKPFYMIRHGQTEANAARVMAGHTDSPLTALGREQAAKARDIMKALNIKPAGVFHSHLSRARDTALILNEWIGAPIFEDPDLAESHAGDFEGAPYEICGELMFNGWPEVPNGESPQAFFTRVKRGKSKAIAQYNDPVLIVCHGGVMRAFGALYGLPTPGKFKNAHLYEFHPATAQKTFPWDVYEYSVCEDSGEIIKSRSEIYDSAAAEIAL